VDICICQEAMEENEVPEEITILFDEEEEFFVDYEAGESVSND